MTKNVVLLIGGNLCRHVAERLDPEHWQIWGLRRNPVADPHIRWLQADVTVPASLRSLPNDLTHVLYAPSPDMRERAGYLATYPLGLDNLLEKTPLLQRFVLVGSSVVWPAADAADAMAWVDETTPTRAENFRAEAILLAEAVLFERLPDRGVALRLGGIYGPGRTRLINRLCSGRLVSPDGPGHWSNRIHIEDAAAACVHLLGLPEPANCYIGTDNHPTVTSQFHAALADLLEMPRPSLRMLPPSGKRLSSERLIASGWRPRWPDALAGYRAIVGK